MFPKTLLFSVSFLLSSFYFLISDSFIQINFPLLVLSTYSFPIGITLDWVSLMFAGSVLLISSMIMIYSQSYVSSKDQKRFFIILLSFVLSMMILVFSNNIFFIMLGWDGLGLSSYILVIFYMNTKSKESGAITILSNRMGDIMIILSISLSMSNGLMDLSASKSFLSLSLCFIIIAACTKSAQFPFMAWLPAAMAAPTPISALVHSSTLVTAGTFILIRTFNSPLHNSLLIILLISSFTMLLSGLSANWEQDFKKIIALSTLSQMAMIMFAISINMINLAFFHLITHAMFKSTMFLCAGAIIHSSQYQDIRTQGISSNWSPTLMMNFNITVISLMGLPFLSGFYSKDAIIEKFLTSFLNSLLIIFILFSLGLTASYSLRLLSMSSKFLNKSKPDILFYNDSLILFPIVIMTPMSIILGSILSWTTFHHQFLTLSLLMKLSIPFIILLGFMMGMILSFNSKTFLLLSESPSSLWFLNKLSARPPTTILYLGPPSTLIDKSWTEISSASGSLIILSFLSKLPDMILLLFLSSLTLCVFIPTLT